MRSFMIILASMAVIGMAFWAYRENYTTQKVLSDTSRLHSQIGLARARLAVLQDEWAYLNRPDRLRELSEINFSRLGLLPLRPDQFGRIDQVAYPTPQLLPVTDAIDVANTEAEQ